MKGTTKSSNFKLKQTSSVFRQWSDSILEQICSCTSGCSPIHYVVPGCSPVLGFVPLPLARRNSSAFRSSPRLPFHICRIVIHLNTSNKFPFCDYTIGDQDEW